MYFRSLFITLLFTTIQATPHTLTVDALIRIALEHSPDIDISRFDFEGAQQRAKYTEGFYLPRLDAALNGGKQRAELKNHTTNYSDILAGSLGLPSFCTILGKHPAGFRVPGPRLWHCRHRCSRSFPTRSWRSSSAIMIF